jgi:hypothetical protein
LKKVREMENWARVMGSPAQCLLKYSKFVILKSSKLGTRRGFVCCRREKHLVNLVISWTSVQIAKLSETLSHSSSIQRCQMLVVVMLLSHQTLLGQ